MKELIIIRHAKSSWSHLDLSDAERPLNKRGLQAAPEMGRRLAQRGICPDAILSSPAVRAATTAKIIAEKTGFSEEAITLLPQLYLAEVPDLMEIIRSLEPSVQRAMLFGHNPGLTSLSNYLANADIDNVPTCGVVRVGFDLEDWSGADRGGGDLLEFDYPKKPAVG